MAKLFANYVADGQSLYGLAKDLMVSPIPAPLGKKPGNPASIRGILTNPAYTGTVCAGRTHSRPARIHRSAVRAIGQPFCGWALRTVNDWILVPHIPAIVSQAQFDLVQAKLAHNRQFAKRNNKAHDYLLRALVSCGDCRIACVARTHATIYAYYACRGKLHPSQSCRDEHRPSRLIPAKQLDELVWQDINDVLLHPESIAQALDRAQGGTSCRRSSRHGVRICARSRSVWASNWSA